MCILFRADDENPIQIFYETGICRCLLYLILHITSKRIGKEIKK